MSYAPGSKAIEARRKRVRSWERFLRKNPDEELGYLIATYADEHGVSEEKVEQYTQMLARRRVLRVLMLDEEGSREVEFLEHGRAPGASGKRRQEPVTEGDQPAYVAGEEPDTPRQHGRSQAVV